MDGQRNWSAWREGQKKFGSVRSSQDFRRKKGILASIGDWLKGLFGKH
ncbi:MAG: hypothetical protein Q7T16_00410 [Candidatus Burarchaeum sp.]|nr:hypothetical protein [Candidatus Burarchaeum sp.]MDO8339101.1 hypothetical protein [Candidatus Burarchaeum sp.]